MPTEREDLIQKRAYQIWEEQGCPEGQDAEHWSRAERELDGELNSGETLHPANGEQLQSEPMLRGRRRQDPMTS